MTLAELQSGDQGIITKVRGRGAFRRRITEMGFIKGKTIKVIKNAPLKDPIEYNILGYDISLRRGEASFIEVISESDFENSTVQTFNGTIQDELLKTSVNLKSKTINVALVGNPNAGKTTIFNFASRSRERVGNYSGVTIDIKTAHFFQAGYRFNVTDLPGTYSISAYSPEEMYVRNFILDETPDVIINIVDASNLERNLYLTTQLIDMDVKVIMALNMYDEMELRKDLFDYVKLGKMLGIPIVPTVGSKGRGVKELFDKVIAVDKDQDPTVRHIHINYGAELEKSISAIQSKIKIESNYPVTDKLSSRYASIKLLENDVSIRDQLVHTSNYREIIEENTHQQNRLTDLYQEEPETLITDAKYGFIAGALKETYQKGSEKKRDATDIIDAFVTHKAFGFPIFLFFLWLMFQATFTLGEHPQAWIESGIGALGNLVAQLMPDGSLKDLMVEGIIGGVGGVIVFLPNIVILFMFISFMEDTGYMSRAAFIMDKLMHKIGLHGKSFIPLIMGFGCNVPAIMATRTIENQRNRLVTMLINPFMSCSARLPVHLLLIGTFFTAYKGIMLFLVYMLGIAVAVGVALVFKKTGKKDDDVPFVMELPPYRMPTLKTTLKHMWNKSSEYLKKMGGVILIASVLIWAMGHYPMNVDYSKNYDESIAVNTERFEQTGDKTYLQKANQMASEKKAEKLEKSYIGRIGHSLEPVIAPLGFDWRMGASLIAGVAAKEIVVSTMGVIYQAGNGLEENTESLSAKLQSATHHTGPKKGQLVFTPLVAFSFIVFILIYFPCVAVIAAIRKESGSWKWATFTIFYTTLIAWGLSFLIYQGCTLISNLL
jgi:ferrous iron transport protein B